MIDLSQGTKSIHKQIEDYSMLKAIMDLRNKRSSLLDDIFVVFGLWQHIWLELDFSVLWDSEKCVAAWTLVCRNNKLSRMEIRTNKSGRAGALFEASQKALKDQGRSER